MRMQSWVAGGLLLLAASASLAASDKVTVRFHEPEHFTDLKSVNGSAKQFRDVTLKQLAAYIEEQASRWLAEGQSLDVTIKDIDLAGQVRPGAPYDKRIVQDVDFPVIRLHYRLTDKGSVVAEGDEELKDMNFLRRPVRSRVGDGLRFEKRLLHDWLRKLLRDKPQVAAH